MPSNRSKNAPKKNSGARGSSSRASKAAQVPERGSVTGDLVGIALAVVAIAMVVSIVAPSSAVITRAVGNGLELAFGAGAILFPLALLAFSATFFVEDGTLVSGRIAAGLTLVVLAVLAIIVALTGGVAVVMGTVGIPVMSFLYGVDFEQFRGLCYVMVATGGVCAAIDFLYQIITVLRRQKAVTRVYLLTLGFSLFIPPLLIGFTGLTGAVLGYLIVMCILLVLLVTEYLSIHAELSETLKSYRKSSARESAE